MMKGSRVLTVVAAVVSLGMTAAVYADAAPVFDADSLQQQFENPGSMGEPSPAPDNAPQAAASTGQDGGTFMPMPSQPSASASSAPAPAAPSVNTANLSTDQRLRRVEQQMNTMQSNDLGSKTDSLQAQVQDLRSQVEQLTHQLAQAQASQKSMYTDLDKRLSSNAPVAKQPAADVSDDDSTPPPAAIKPSAKASTVKPAVLASAKKTNDTKVDAAKPDAKLAVAATKSETELNGAQEQQIYQTAYELIKTKKYSQAVTTLQGMLKKYPSGQFASNAHYWLGELYGLTGKNDQALAEFLTIVRDFPDSPRVADAQLKVGLIFAAQNQWPDAKLAFKKVSNKYPGTASAKLATEQLKQLSQAGH